MFKSFNILILLTFLLCKVAVAQKGHPILDDYDVFQLNGKVYISVTVSSGQTCNGINVQRSADSLSYQQIGHVVGICGSSASPITYDFVDDYPIKNKTSYYRVELGGYGYTTVASILVIDTQEFGFQVRPSPARDNTIIYFDNPQQEEFELVLFNLSGLKVKTKHTISNSFELNVSDLNKGLYFFTIGKNYDEQKTIGKLMVQH